MKLEKVSIEDIYPDENNPRQSFEGIDELAESFDINTERPGEPFTPPLTVRDGGIYRIVDGERRYRALKKRGTHTVTVTVCESMDEANAMMAMLATDDKQPLSDIERSRGVQQMILLGVDPVEIEKASKVKGVSRIKRAMDAVDDAAEDMTLDRLLAIEEFADDPDMVEQLSTCKETEWARLVEARRYEIKREADLKALTDALVGVGVEIVDEVDYTAHAYDAYLSSVEAVVDKYGDHAPDGTVATPSGYSASVTTYVPRSDSPDAPSAEEQERQRKVDEMVIAVDAAYDARLQFIASKLGKVPMADMMPILDVIVEASIAIRSHRDAVDAFNDMTGSAVEVEINDAMFVSALYYGWSQPDRSDISRMLSCVFCDYLKPTATDFVNLTAALKALGYEMTPEDEAVEQMCTDFLAR